MGKLNSLMQVKIYTFCWLLFFKNDNLKYTATSQRRSIHSFLLFYIFFLVVFFLLFLLKLSCTKKHHVYNMFRIWYTLGFCYVMYYIVSEIYLDGRFLEDCFYCYSRQVISAVANGSLIPYNLIKRAQETQSL